MKNTTNTVLSVLFPRRLDARTAARLARISRRSVGLPIHARAPRLTPPMALLSLESMPALISQAEVRSWNTTSTETEHPDGCTCLDCIDTTWETMTEFQRRRYNDNLQETMAREARDEARAYGGWGGGW